MKNSLKITFFAKTIVFTVQQDSIGARHSIWHKFFDFLRPSDSHLGQHWRLKQAKTLKNRKNKTPFLKISNGGSDGGGTFCLHFRNLQKIWLERSIDLSSVRFGRSCDIG